MKFTPILFSATLLCIPQQLHAEPIQNHLNRAAQAQAMNNMRQIGLTLLMFDADYGSYPSEQTRADVEEATGKKLPADDPSSNALFRQLIIAEIASIESIFYANIPGVKKPDNNIQDGQILTQGENAFAYIAGQNSAGRPDRPTVLAPLIPGTTKFDPKPFGGMALVLRNDNSVQSLPIAADGTVLVNGVDLLSPENPIWGGKAPDIRYPDIALPGQADPEFKDAIGEVQASVKSLRVEADINALRSAVEAYKINAGIYPTSEQGLEALVTKPEASPIPRRWVRVATAVPADPWGNPYQYRMPGTKTPELPDIFSMGPDGKPGTDDDITSP